MPQTYAMVPGALMDRVPIIYVQPWKTLAERFATYKRQYDWKKVYFLDYLPIQCELTATLLYVFPDATFTIVPKTVTDIVKKYLTAPNVSLKLPEKVNTGVSIALCTFPEILKEPHDYVFVRRVPIQKVSEVVIDMSSVTYTIIDIFCIEVEPVPNIGSVTTTVDVMFHKIIQ